MKEVDTRGLSCPEPIMLTQEATLSGENELEILVDTVVAKENVERFLANAGYRSTTSDEGDYFKISASK